MSHVVPAAPRKVEKTVRANLEVPLTDEEVKAKTDQMVADMTALEEDEAEFKAVKAEWSERLKTLKAKIKDARKIVATRTETKLVEDAVQVYDLDKKRTWIEYRGQEFKNMAMSEFEMKAMIKPPLFPEHDDAADGEEEEGDDVKAVRRAADERNGLVEQKTVDGRVLPVGDDDEPPTEPFPAPSNVSDIEQVRRESTKRGSRKDHTARG